MNSAAQLNAPARIREILTGLDADTADVFATVAEYDTREWSGEWGNCYAPASARVARLLGRPVNGREAERLALCLNYYLRNPARNA